MLTNSFFKTRRVRICDFYSAKTCSAAHATPRLENRATGFGKQISNQPFLMAVIRGGVTRGDLIKGYYFFSSSQDTSLHTHSVGAHVAGTS